MAILVLKLASVKRKTELRPKACPYCQGETFQRWGKTSKPIRDIRCRRVTGISVPLLPLQADLSTLSRRD